MTTQSPTREEKIMRIGLTSAALNLSTKLFVRSMYCDKGSHVKQFVLRSVALALPLLLSILASSVANAGNLKSDTQMATAEKYFDWGYAQHVWFDLNTTKLLDAEYAKYAGDFEPWLARYKKNPRDAFAVLDKMPKAQRLRVQRGYDVQLAWDQWFDHVYSTWYNGYRHEAVVAASPAINKKAPTFDDVVALTGQRAKCIPERMLNECGPVPDWRSERMLRELAALFAATQKEIAENKAKRAKRGW